MVFLKFSMPRITSTSLWLLALTLPSWLHGENARELLELAGVKGGIVVQLGIGDGTLIQGLRANASY